MQTNLMGIDVGFSITRPTTGIACLEGDHLTLKRAGTGWESREAKIPDNFQPSVIAIDGPLLPFGADLNIRRHVESVFIRAPFHNRCRPGRLESLLSENLDLPDVVWQSLRSETDHELRAALICLLTAALADKGTASIVGEAQGGWFWLPPWSLWQPWATRGLESAERGWLQR